MKLNILIIVIISLILGFRPPFGTDYYSYQSIWYGISSNFLTVEYAYLEPGFILIIKIIKQFFSDYKIFLTIFSFLIFFPLIFIKKRPEFKYILFIYLCMFFFPYTINGIRQALIISISIYLIHKLSFENYNFKKLFLISFLSIFIHASGIFLLVFLLIRRIKITPFFLSIYLIIGLILIRYFFGDYLNLRFNTEISTSYFQIIVRILLFIAVYLCYTFKVIPKFYLNIYVIGFITYVFFFDLNQFSTRINMSFRVIELFTFAKLFNLKKVNFSRYIIKRLMMIYFLSLLTINIIQNV